jgi:predicted  nucleic acid-binding Zn-ribbon protein
MSRSRALYLLQELDTNLDTARNRIQEINLLLKDKAALEKARQDQQSAASIHQKRSKTLKNAEHEVALQNQKIEQNQKKLYGGGISNPKELEDLQLESLSLAKYLQVLEERQLEAMLAADQSQEELDAAELTLQTITQATEKEHASLKEESKKLSEELSKQEDQKNRYIETEELPDLPDYQSLRDRSGGIAVTLMVDSSCLSCGANIPSAIEQTAKSPTKLAFCPTCGRILHPGD